MSLPPLGSRGRRPGAGSGPVLLRQVPGAVRPALHAGHAGPAGSPLAAPLREHHAQLHRHVEVGRTNARNIT